MPTIEERALALVYEVKSTASEWFWTTRRTPSVEALCRALEALDAERAAHAQFRQEVSDDLLGYFGEDDLALGKTGRFRRYIIPKPVDPLVEVLGTMLRRRTFEPAAEVVADEAAWLRAALAKRGLKLVGVGDAD